MTSITTAAGTYTISYRRENSALVDIILNGRTTIASGIPAADADEKIARHTELVASRKAVREAWEARGIIIVRDASDMPRAARMRHMNRVALYRTADEQLLDHYASIDEVPMPEPTTETVETADATVETVEVEAVRGTITDTQIATILDLVAAGAHEEGGFYAGPTTEAGVRAMSRDDAATYITSLTGRY
ncbi:hypothetical protein ACTQ43_12865 [Segatella copri]|uniref:hypothetical protein n=1 Tax=Bacteria TaxID=2 RepID=UPI003F8B6CF3